MSERPEFRQLLLAHPPETDQQIDPRKPNVIDEQPEDDRPRRPTPCPECNSREITDELVCAGCGWWRDDLEDDATLSEDLPPMGWEVWNGQSWEYELPFTHRDPPPIDP